MRGHGSIHGNQAERGGNEFDLQQFRRPPTKGVFGVEAHVLLPFKSVSLSIINYQGNCGFLTKNMCLFTVMYLMLFKKLQILTLFHNLSI